MSGYRKGYEPKRVHTAGGTVELQVQQLRENLESPESVWLQAIGKRSKSLFELVAMLYVKGMSQRDIEDALIEVLGVEGTGRGVITELCNGLRADFERWQSRGLSVHGVLHLCLDGIYLKLRPEDERATAVLCDQLILTATIRIPGFGGVGKLSNFLIQGGLDGYRQ